MDATQKAELERLKELLLQTVEVWVDGVDFQAINYGDESRGHVPSGCDSKITSAFGSFIVSRETGQWRFIDSPYMPFREASHLPKLERVKVNLGFAELKECMLRGTII